MMTLFLMYSYSEDNCKDNPCENGACVNVDREEDERGFICACYPGYIGDFCETGKFESGVIKIYTMQ